MDPIMSEEKIITNDLYCAAFLITKGCTVEKIAKNSRRRISMVVTGNNVQSLRDEYRKEIVKLNVKKYRDSIRYVRNLMDECQRSTLCPNNIPKKK